MDAPIEIVDASKHRTDRAFFAPRRTSLVDRRSAQLGLDEPTDAMLQGAPAAPMAVAPSSEDPTCKPAPTDTCKTSCSLSDSICGNAEKICKLAQDMAGDAWAQNKCAKANQTCEASRTKCCGCQ